MIPPSNLICHDVFQSSYFSRTQLEVISRRSMLDRFLDCFEQLKDFDVQIELCCLSERIDSGWLRYVKGRKFSYSLHGLVHRDYRRITEEEAYKELSTAKDLLELSVEQEVNKFIPPKLFSSPTLVRAALRAGLTVELNHCRPYHVLEGIDTDSVYFHYWKDDFDKVIECLQEPKLQEQ